MNPPPNETKTIHIANNKQKMAVYNLLSEGNPEFRYEVELYLV